MDDQATQDDTDINLSRGRRAENDATRWYQNTIRNQAPTYFEEDNRNGRRAIVTEILNQMNGHGYRFRWNGANDTRTLNPEVVRQSFYYVLHNDQQRTILLQEGIASPTQIDQWRRLNPLTDIGQVDQWANNPNNLDPAIAAHHTDDIRQNLPNFIGGNDGIVIDIAGLDEMIRRRRVAEDLNRANQRRDDANNGGGGDDGNDSDGEEDQSGNDSSNEGNNDEEGGNDGNDSNGEGDQSGIDNSSEENNDEGNEFDEEEDHSGIKTTMKGLIDYEEKIKSQRKQEVTRDIKELKSGIEEMESFKLEIESLEQEKRISRMQEINSRREEMDSQSEEMSSCMQEISSRMQEVYSFIQKMDSSEQETDTSSVVKEMDSLWEEMEILPMGILRQKKISRYTKIEIDDMEFHIQLHEMISHKLEEESDMLEIIPQYATKKVLEKKKS